MVRLLPSDKQVSPLHKANDLYKRRPNHHLLGLSSIFVRVVVSKKWKNKCNARNKEISKTI